MDWLQIEPMPAPPEPEYPVPRRTPYISVGMGAACCEPHVNEYYADGAYLWVLLEEDGYDLCPEHDSVFDEGTMPATMSSSGPCSRGSPPDRAFFSTWKVLAPTVLTRGSTTWISMHGWSDDCLCATDPASTSGWWIHFFGIDVS